MSERCHAPRRRILGGKVPWNSPNLIMNVTFGRREAFRAIRHFRPERATKESDEIAVGAENERGYFTEAAKPESFYRR